jgi:hypothetical protein
MITSGGDRNLAKLALRQRDGAARVYMAIMSLDPPAPGNDAGRCAGSLPFDIVFDGRLSAGRK